MLYQVDHDYHFHTNLSLCCKEKEMTAQAAYEMAEALGYRRICVTDHTWDPSVPKGEEFFFYRDQPIERTESILPLPKGKVAFDFGCETEYCHGGILGMAPESFDRFDFVVIPTTHMHFDGFTIPEGMDAKDRARLYIERMEELLSMPIPFYKVGIAHPACGLIYSTNGHHATEVLPLIKDEDYHRIFAACAKAGCGIELNRGDVGQPKGAYQDEVLRIYRIAREEKCRFYCSSDAHERAGFMAAKKIIEDFVAAIGLTEDEKFDYRAKH